MEKIKKLFLLMAILFPAIAFTACSDDEPKEPLRAKFKESSIILRVDETSVLQVVIESGNIEMDKAVWKSSNNDVATVSNGIVTAVSVGKVDISLSYNYGHENEASNNLFHNSLMSCFFSLSC